MFVVRWFMSYPAYCTAIPDSSTTGDMVATAVIPDLVQSSGEKIYAPHVPPTLQIVPWVGSGMTSMINQNPGASTPVMLSF